MPFLIRSDGYAFAKALLLVTVAERNTEMPSSTVA